MRAIGIGCTIFAGVLLFIVLAFITVMVLALGGDV